jgi:hypothetical protein
MERDKHARFVEIVGHVGRISVQSSGIQYNFFGYEFPNLYGDHSGVPYNKE